MSPNRISLTLLEFEFAFFTSPERERPGKLQSAIISMQSSKRDRRDMKGLKDTDLYFLIC